VKLWLDDIREPPGTWLYATSALDHIANGREVPDWWVWANTAHKAIRVLQTGRVTECSLDHDLAEEHYAVSTGYCEAPAPPREMTGYDVVKWMAEHNVWPEIVRVHSMNPAGAEAMRKLIERSKP